MRVVFTASGSRGDVQPLLALALSARTGGHDDVFGAPPNFAAWVRERGLAFHPVGSDAEKMLTAQAAAATGSAFGVVRTFSSLLDDEIAAQFRDLPGILDGAELIIGGGLPLAAPSLAEARGVPFHLTVYCPALLRSAHHAPMMAPWQGLPRFCNRLLWRMSDVFYKRLVVPPVDHERGRIGLPPVADLYRHFTTNTVIIAADEVLAPLPPDVGVPVVRCGAAVLPVHGALPPALAEFLAAGPQPVYCGFGSMPDPRPDRTAALIVEAAQAAGVRLVLSRGWARLDPGRLPEGVLVIDAVPHEILFPLMRTVVHHGGAGTTAAASRAGVPQVLVPHLMDQHYWAARLLALGVAPPPLARPRLSARRLAASLRAALMPDLAQRARILAKRLRPPLTFAELLPHLRRPE